MGKSLEIYYNENTASKSNNNDDENTGITFCILLSELPHLINSKSIKFYNQKEKSIEHYWYMNRKIAPHHYNNPSV